MTSYGPYATAGGLTVQRLSDEIVAALGADATRAVVGNPDGHLVGPPSALVISYTVPLTAPDEATLAATVTAHDGESLAEYQARHTRLVDDEAERRIHHGPGFEHPPGSGKFFSLTANAQTKWNGLLLAKDMIDHVNDPVRVRTKDDQAEVQLADAAEVVAYWGTALTTVRVHLNDGRIAKQAVLDAVDKAGVDAAFTAYMGA
jgi:hypothetical protein